MRSIFALIFGCLIFTPAFAIDNSSLATQLHSDGILEADETVLFTSYIYFYDGKKGFSLLTPGKPRVKAQIVLSEKSLRVVRFVKGSKRFELIHGVQYTQLASVQVAGNSPLVRLVTEHTKKDHFDSFDLMDTRNSFSPSSAKTFEAKKLIAAGIQGIDLTTVASGSSLSSVQMIQQKTRIEELEARVQRLEERLDSLAEDLK